MAFECLLKGFISLVRLENGESPPLPKDCYTHRLEALARRPECVSLAITMEEMEALSRLSPYIEWSGRYPVPKRAKELHFVGVSNFDRDAELRLWHRLVSLLGDRAWVMKGGPVSKGGYKLYLDGRKEKLD